MSDPKAKLLYEFVHGQNRYRLIACGKWTAGYEDSYKIEILGQDGLGEPRWDYAFGWNRGNSGTDLVQTMLVDIIKTLLQETVHTVDPDDKGMPPWG